MGEKYYYMAKESSSVEILKEVHDKTQDAFDGFISFDRDASQKAFMSCKTMPELRACRHLGLDVLSL